MLPPGCFVVLLAGLAFYLRKSSRRGALACAALAALVWVGTARVFSDALLHPLEYAYPAAVKPQGDVIVMLYGGFRGGGNPFSASERLAPGTLERAAAVFKLYKNTGLHLVISGGAPFSAEPEAEAAAAYLEELGVPADRIIPEKASRDTYENAAFTFRICRERGFKRVILVTSAYHMPRAVLLFKKTGFGPVTPFPVAYRSGRREHNYLVDYLPGSGLESRTAINEYLGLLYYRFFWRQ